MNRRTLFLIIGFIALNLLSASVRAEDAKPKDHSVPGSTVDPVAAGRPTVEQLDEEQSYTTLKKSLDRPKISGISPKKLLGLDDKELADKKISFAELVGEPGKPGGLKKWVETFTTYRLMLANCDVSLPKDPNAPLFGKYLDGFMKELSGAIVDGKGTSAKKLVTMISQMEGYLNVKKSKGVFGKELVKDLDKSSQEPTELGKIDDAFLAQLKKTYEMLFGSYDTAKKDFDVEKAKTEKITEAGVDKFPLLPLVEEMNKNIDFLKRTATDASPAVACKPAVAVSTSSPVDADKAKKDKAAKDLKDKEEKEALAKKAKEDLSKKIAAPKLIPGPPTGKLADGSTPTPTPTPTPTEGPVPFAPPNAVQNPNVFDQLQPIVDNLRNQGAQLAADLDKRIRDAERLGQQALADLARQQQLQNQDRNNNDAANEALKINRQGDRSNTETPPAPITPPNISPDLSSRGNNTPPPVPPSEPEPFQPQPIPFQPPPAQAGGPTIISSPAAPTLEPRRRDYSVPVQQSSAVLDMLRASQAQLAQALQTAAQQRAAVPTTGNVGSRILNGPRRNAGGRQLPSRVAQRLGGRTGAAAISSVSGNSALSRGPNGDISIAPNRRTNLPEAVLSRGNISVTP